MARDKITSLEIEQLVAFGKELERRMDAARLGLTDLSRLTGGKVSTTYLSDIVRAGRGNSQKFFRVQREKARHIAMALEWDEDEALKLLGYSGTPKQSDDDKTPALYRTVDPKDQMMFNLERFVRLGSQFEELTVEEQEEYSRLLNPIAENIERRVKRRKK